MDDKQIQANIGLDQLAAADRQYQTENPQALPGPDQGVGSSAYIPSLAEKNAQVLVMVLGMARDVVCMVADLKSPKQTLRDENIKVLADAWGKVAEKHQLDLATIQGNYALELSAAFATFIIGKAVYEGVNAELGQSKIIDGQAPFSDFQPSVKPDVQRAAGASKPIKRPVKKSKPRRSVAKSVPKPKPAPVAPVESVKP